MKYRMFIYQSPGVLRDEGCILHEVYDVYLPEPGRPERRGLYSSWSIGCLFARARASRRDEGCILHEVYDVYLPEPGRPGEMKVVFFMKYMMFIYQSPGVQEKRRLYSSWSIWCLFTRARASRRDEGCILHEVYDVYLPEPGRPGETKVVFFMKYRMFIYQSPGVQERWRLYSSWSIWCLFTRARASRRDEGCILHEVYDVYLPEPGRPGGTKVVFFMKYMMFICQSPGVLRDEGCILHEVYDVYLPEPGRPGETRVVFFMKYMMFIYQSPGVQERWRLYSSWSIWCLFTRARASRRDEGCILPEVYDVYLPEPGRPGETKVVFFMKYRMFICQSPGVQERRRLYSSWSIWCLFTRARASRRDEGCILPEVYDVYLPEPGRPGETKVVFFMKYRMFICQSPGVQERRRLYSSWSIGCLFTRAWASRRDEGCILHEVYDVYLPEPGRPERRRLYSSWSIGCLFTRAQASWETKVVFFMKYMMFIYQSLGVQERRRLYSSWSIGCLFTRARASWETRVVFFMKYRMFIYQSPAVQERRRLYSSWSIWCLFTRAWASRRDEGCILHEV